MALDHSLVGAASEPVTFAVERGAILRFAEAIGDENPVYRQGSAAPPTFPTTFRLTIPGLEAIAPARFIHGNEEYTYERPIKAGDLLTCQRRVTDLFVKQGKLGEMTFVVATIEGRDPEGALVFEGKTTVIIHGKGD